MGGGRTGKGRKIHRSPRSWESFQHSYTWVSRGGGRGKTEKSKWDVSSINEDPELGFFMDVRRKENKYVTFFFSHIESCFLRYQPRVERHGPMIPIKLHAMKKLKFWKMIWHNTVNHFTVAHPGLLPTGHRLLFLHCPLPVKTRYEVNRTCLLSNKPRSLLWHFPF